MNWQGPAVCTNSALSVLQNGIIMTMNSSGRSRIPLLTLPVPKDMSSRSRSRSCGRICSRS